MNREWLPPVAGVLEIVSGISALIGGGLLVFAALVINSVPEVRNDPEIPVELLSTLLVSLAGFIVLAGVMALAGGVAGVKRGSWGWALGGAIAAVFVMPPAGIVALILILFGEKEFASRADSGDSVAFRGGPGE